MTDYFTTAAEDAAERSRDEVLGGPWNGQYDANYIRGFESGAAWARDHLAQQEPTEAEIRAVMKVARTHYSMPLGVGPSFARAVIEAARTARRDEEKR